MNTNNKALQTIALQTMLSGLVDYKIAKESVPPITAAEYEYLWAGNGIFIRSASRFWEAKIQVASFETPGLLPAESGFKWLEKRLDKGFLQAIYTEAHQACGPGLSHPVEVLYRIEKNHAMGCYELVEPKQTGSYSSVSSADVGGMQTMIEVHSHHLMETYWSQTDDLDHQGKRIYGVIGNFGEKIPKMRLRLSIHGHRIDIPITDLFESNSVFVDGSFS
jgi:hypothetical protein